MKVIVLTGLLLIALLAVGYPHSRDFDACLSLIVKPHLFSVVRWESKVIAQALGPRAFGGQGKIESEASLVNGYFLVTEQIKSLNSAIELASDGEEPSSLAATKAELEGLSQQQASARVVARIIEKQIRDTLSEQGIFNPLVELRVGFPPVNFSLEKPPYLLVVSPRDRIESLREVTLQPSLASGEIEKIEAGVDKLGVSSLVVELAGLGATYPTLVSREAGLRSTIEVAVEEWLHQYLAFKPLGFLYLLDLTGLARNYEIATMNETLAGMVSKEIGALVYGKYYAQFETDAKQNLAPEPRFDFNQEMREIRKAVDAYLTQGEVESAEEFMEEKRQYLAAKGYYLRKLNQAYFAFYGAYADSPTSISPIGLELKELRAESASLRDFLNTAASMTSPQQLSGRLSKNALSAGLR